MNLLNEWSEGEEKVEGGEVTKCNLKPEPAGERQRARCPLGKGQGREWAQEKEIRMSECGGGAV